MTEEISKNVAAAQLASMSPDQVLAILKNVDLAVPQLKAFLAATANNPLLATLATHLFPSLAPIIPLLQQIGPYLDFLLPLVQKVEAALADALAQQNQPQA